MAFSIDEGFAYASRLRGRPEEINPSDWIIDWSDAPWPFKLYASGQPIRLTSGYPPWLGISEHTPHSLDAVGRMLFYAAGCTRVRSTPGGIAKSGPERPQPVNRDAQLSVRRALASGGGMYPAEMYIYARMVPELPVGLYHYNPASHTLLDLGLPVSDYAVAEALGIEDPSVLPSVVVIITNYFWKNFYKYGDFSYRLGAVDLGVALGRLHRLGRHAFGSVSAYFRFNDCQLNALLGLDGLEESAYVTLLLGTGQPLSRIETASVRAAPQTDLPAPQQLFTRQRSKRIKRSRDFDAMHQSVLSRCAILETGYAATTDHARTLPTPTIDIKLPQVAPLELEHVRNAILHRTSNGDLFTGDSVSANLLAMCLHEAEDALRQVRATAPDRCLPVPHLYCTVQRVEGIPAGVYSYHPASHTLTLIQPGYFGLALQAALRVRNINIDLSAFTIHVIDQLDFRDHPWGNRTYRVQQMCAGVVLDAVMVASSALGAGSHALLGFDTVQIDQLYKLDTSLGALAQICVGAARLGPYLEASVVA